MWKPSFGYVQEYHYIQDTTKMEHLLFLRTTLSIVYVRVCKFLHSLVIYITFRLS